LATSVTAEAIASIARPASPDVAAICCDAAETVPAELETSLIVALQRAPGLAQHLVERAREPADLVPGLDVDRRGDRAGLLREVALGDGLEAVGERDEAVVVERLQARGERVHRAGDGAGDPDRERDGAEQRDQRDDEDVALGGAADDTVLAALSSSWRSRSAVSSSEAPSRFSSVGTTRSR
jgi:hypothetical protein